MLCRFIVIRILILFLSISVFSEPIKAQVHIFAGPGISYVRNHNLVKNQKPLVSFHFGSSFNFYSIKKWPNLSFIVEPVFIQKGYRMASSDTTFVFRFSYFSFDMLVKYDLSQIFSVQAGIENSLLLFTNKYMGVKTYSGFDLGIILGFEARVNKRISFYSRFDYGTIALVDYYSFDKLGNFTGEIHDLFNTCILAGIKIQLNREKIKFYE